MDASAIALKECRHGRMLYLRGDQYIGRSLELYGEYGEREGRMFAQLLGAGQAAVEIGANIGAHTVHLARLVGPTGTVLAFEPQRAMFYLLCANLALNEQFQVRAYRAGVGNAVGSVNVPLFDHRSNANFGAVSLLRREPVPEETVPLTTLDQYPLASLRLLKIDVEGMEVQVVQGARQTIATHRPVIYIENDRREKSAELIGLIQGLGYDLYWDLPPLFNPDNFAGNPDDVFSRILSINMACFPSEARQAVANMRRVSGPDDWWNEPR